MALRARGCREACNAWVGKVPGVGRLFFASTLRVPQLLPHQEAVGGDGQARMVMEAAPASSLVVAQSQVLFQVLVVALDTPAHLGFEHHALNGSVRGQGGQPVLHRLIVSRRPLDERPLLRSQFAALFVAVCGMHPNPGKA